MTDQLAEWPPPRTVLDVLAKDADKWRQLSITCETCGGSTYYDEATGYATSCPDCTDGWRVNPEAVRAGVKALGSLRDAELHAMVEYVLQAVIEWAEREEE